MVISSLQKARGYSSYREEEVMGKILAKVPNDAINSLGPPTEQIKAKEQFLSVCCLYDRYY